MERRAGGGHYALSVPDARGHEPLPSHLPPGPARCLQAILKGLGKLEALGSLEENMPDEEEEEEEEEGEEVGGDDELAASLAKATL